ncbi:amino acid transporter [Camelimonas fluminis]|uniref:LysE family translocator n=1 Tax=Camelimonas fluminis TaxID=1576911 RepID=A0ABV7UJS5_9HYPH|nr:LysE family translocator [Camelimonas fluminis]GHE80906.1 amino acid transporter [Camelimonas fluminis]
MDFIPALPVLASYTLACIILFITPGPDMSLFLAKTICEGRRSALAAVAGAESGCLIHTLLAALGVSALLAASATAFLALKIVGALYLLWLAIGAIRHGSVLKVDATRQTQAPPLLQSYLTGLGVNLTNPKVVLFFVTFLPQFVSAHDPHAMGKLAFLGVWFVVLTTPLSALLVLAAGAIIRGVRARPWLVRALDYLFAGIFGLFALKILATQSRGP